MFDAIRTLNKYRGLLYMFVWRNIRIKYKQSVMGFMWAIFMPMLIVAAGALVKYAMAVVSGNPFDISQVATVSVKALPWAFVVSTLRFSTQSLTSNNNLVTKIYFPKEIFPISAMISQLFDFILAAVVLTVILVVAQVGLSWYLLYVPLLILCLVVLVTGMSVFLAAANLFFRDVKYLVEVILTFAIFFTPVFYEVSLFGDGAKWMLLNPVAPLLEALCSVILEQRLIYPEYLLYSATVSVLGLVLGFKLFKKVEPAFAESI
jgi:lipopolysaccharide transport system permease protein